MRPTLFVLLLVSFLSAVESLAATRTWTGTNSGSWSDPGNWGGIAPVANDDLVFPLGPLNLTTNNDNDYPPNTAFRSITINGSYYISGNAITLGAGGLSINATKRVLMWFPITLSASQPWFWAGSPSEPPEFYGNVSLNGATLTLGNHGGTIVGVISGTGTIVVSSGGWFFSGANTYTGQTFVNGGSLGGQLAGSFGLADSTLANGTIINGGFCYIGNATINEYIRIYPNAAGNASLTSGITDLQGTLELVSGQIGIYADYGHPRFLGKITGNGGLTIRASDNLSIFEFSNPADDFQGPFVAQSVSVKLNADHVLPPRDVTLIDSTLDLQGMTQTIASLSGSGLRLKLGAGGTLNVVGPATTIFDGSIQDSGIVALKGGDLTLRGASTFTGSFTNSGGTLRVMGPSAVMPAPYTQSSGTFVVSDSGTAGPVAINGGTFVPGAVGVAFAKTGNLSLGGGTAYRELIDGPAAGSFALTRVTGGVSLGGSVLLLTGSGAGVAAGTQLMIIDNDGSDPVAGTFNGLPEGAVIPLGPGNVYYRISYTGGTGNDVVLTALTATNVPALSPLALLVLGAMLAATAVIALRQ